MQINQLAGSISPVAKSNNQQSRATEYSSSGNTAGKFVAVRQNQQAPAPQQICTLIAQTVSTIQAVPGNTVAAKCQPQENPALKTDCSSYFYMSDNAGYSYLIDGGSMKIIQAKYTASPSRKK